MLAAGGTVVVLSGATVVLGGVTMAVAKVAMEATKVCKHATCVSGMRQRTIVLQCRSSTQLARREPVINQ